MNFSPEETSSRIMAAPVPLGVSIVVITSAVLLMSTPTPFLFASEPTMLHRWTYPETRQVDHVDDYHGLPVADPYRWMEDLDSQETKAWIAEQNELTFGYLQSLDHRQALRERLEQVWDYERFGLPRRRDGRYFFTHNDGLQNQDVLYVAQSLYAPPQVLLDVNKLSEDGTVSLAGWSVSDDGRWLAYGLAHSGSDWREWKVRDVETGEDLDDHLQWIKFSGISWTRDGAGFYYSRYDEPEAGAERTQQNFYQKLYYHRLGDPQSADTLVYERPDEKQWGFNAHVTEDDRYVVIHVWRGTERRNQLFTIDRRQDPQQVVELLTGFDAQYHFIGNDDSTWYLITDRDAPRKRIVALDVTNPSAELREIVGQSDDVLRSASLLGDHLYLSYMKDAHSDVRVYDLHGRPVRQIALPGLGTVSGFGGRRDATETFYSFTNFTTPARIYRYDLETGQSSLYQQPEVSFDPDDYVTKQVFYSSQDGTQIPMFITHRRDLAMDGCRPTLLYGYGGFNASLTPSFSPSNLVWLESGGVYAVANLRGGGEYGRQWHEAGKRENKQNVFDDFIAAAQWLVDSGYTRPQKLAIRGGSNGGLLVGAAMTQRPDLFAAVVASVGVMDMLRYHRFTIGWAWISEYGSADDPQEFEILFRYSPLHNIQSGTGYPATLITTADHDDRVVPAHSFKFAATLQAAQQSEKPVLLRVETSSGHGAGTPTAKRLDEAADVLAFLYDQLVGGE